jgi:hypothetical protein
MTTNYPFFLNRVTHILLVLCIQPITNAFAVTVPVAVNLPIVISEPITSGQQSAELTFNLSGHDSLQLQIIAPVEGVELTVINPSGISWLQPADPNVDFLDGSLLTPALPGGMFITPLLNLPSDGEWLVRLDFPAASVNTIALVSVYSQTNYQTGIVIDKVTYRLGQTAALGLIVLDNGIPIKNLSPILTVTPPIAPNTALVGLDNGDIDNYDGLADDGIYSGGYTFDEIGTHSVIGEVSLISTSGLAIQRSAQTQVEVTTPFIELISVDGTSLAGPGGCIAGLNLDIETNVLEPSTYLVKANFSAAGGGSLEHSVSRDVTSTGTELYSLLFSSEDILNAIEASGPFGIDELMILSFQESGVVEEIMILDAFEFTGIEPDDLCVPDIAISKIVTTNAVIQDGYIESLVFSFPVTTAEAGLYAITGKVTDTSGQDVQVFSLDLSLSAGSNEVSIEVPSAALQSLDGPYSIESVLIVGQGASAQASLIGTSGVYSHWQFYPIIEGDLDNDGDVDVNDRTVLLNYRNQPPMSPGDRRDLTRDGNINIIDVRLLQRLVCSLGSCPSN